RRGGDSAWASSGFHSAASVCVCVCLCVGVCVCVCVCVRVCVHMCMSGKSDSLSRFLSLSLPPSLFLSFSFLFSPSAHRLGLESFSRQKALRQMEEVFGERQAGTFLSQRLL